ncbi:hypothetical protein [Mucilaginibacter segetis]|uniref:DUF3606 domain-containing protein n=1 Tax=Mucilaginibacter segetis TaxID=2793071 RepID=A0A934UMB9_9SPHI|nr:hypothetical protein [Mucilaginibacter segetis]MBK0379239.1 hypothetical protein [Mucilaginibacter segetis]
MSTRGSKVERRSVSDQPHELNYEARKDGVNKDVISTAKKSAGSNQRQEVEKQLTKEK